jgi:polygalacturonase
MRAMRFLLFLSILFVFQTNLKAQDYNILDFGAIPDGVSLNTEMIQQAVDAAFHQGGGRVIVPAGRFLSGSIILKSGVELHLQKEAVLLGSTDPSHYIKLSRWKALLMAEGASHIALTGEGQVDGQGRALALHIDSLFYAGQIDSADYNFVERRPKYYLRPQLIEFVRVKNIVVKNVTLKNAACWVSTYDQCENILIDSVNTISDAYWNNDGIDISDCKNVRITNCFVNSADDGICLKSHSSQYICDSVYIANCTVRSSASAIKFGTVSHGGFTNVRIENIKVYDTFRSAVALECVDGGVMENVVIDNIHAVNTGNAIFIRLGQRTGEVGTLRNIVLRNFTIEVAFERPDYAYDIRGPALPYFHNTFPSSITGLPGHPVQDVLLENIEILYPGRGNSGLAYRSLYRLDDIPEKASAYPEFSMFGELPAWGFYVRHMEGLTMRNIKLRIGADDYRPAFVFDDVDNLNLEAIEIEGDRKPNPIVLHQSRHIMIDGKQSE